MTHFIDLSYTTVFIILSILFLCLFLLCLQLACQLNILPSVATDGNDEHGLNLEKAGRRFSGFNAMPAKITKK